MGEFSIWHWLVIFIFGGIVYVVYRAAHPKPTKYNQSPRELSSGHRNSKDQTKSSAELGDFMFGLLRFIRGFCGLLFVMQIVSLLPVLTWLQQPDAVTGDMWAFLFIKVLALALFGFLFFGLRSFINWLHTKKHGAPHPALAKKKLTL